NSTITILPALRRYYLLLPPLRGDRVVATIEAPTVTVAGRDLGVAVSEVMIASLASHVPIPVVFALVIVMIGNYALARQMGVARRIIAPVLLLLALLTLLWHAYWGWRYGLSNPLLYLLGSVGLAGAVLEHAWLRPVAPAEGSHTDPGSKLYEQSTE